MSKENSKIKDSVFVDLLIAEYDYDTDIAVKREEAWEDGHEVGLEEGECVKKSL